MVFVRQFKLPLILSVIITILVIGCTKLDTTSIGTDVIPEVDNVNTFADTIDIITTQGAFEGIYKDSTKLSLTEEYVIGKLNDPLLGSTEANLFLQLKPPFYPYYIGVQPKDTIVQADSAVLCLSFKAFYGDSTQPLQFQVYEISEDAHGEWDSVFNYRTINYAPLLNTPISAVKTVDIRQMEKFVKLGKSDSINYQIRIKLNDAFKDSLFRRDTTRNKAFLADSLFRIYNNGFAVKAISGNALLYVNLLESQTRLELHYKRKNGGAVDTAYSNFYFNSGLQGEIIRRSSVANNIIRNRNPLPSGDQELYLQTTPGTFANLEMPALTNYGNKIVHRAELQISQIPDPINDKIFLESNYLYLDLIDTGANKWKPVYFDLNPSSAYDPDFKTIGYPYFPSNGDVDLNYFGGYLRKRQTSMGAQGYYNINLTRYIQQLATKKTTNYKMRLFPAHSFSYPQYSSTVIPYRNPIAFGRVRVGGGANPNPQYRMRLRVVYSKIK
jgi:hypothetical protein